MCDYLKNFSAGRMRVTQKIVGMSRNPVPLYYISHQKLLVLLRMRARFRLTQDIGGVPSLCVILFRFGDVETRRYMKQMSRNVLKNNVVSLLGLSDSRLILTGITVIS